MHQSGDGGNVPPTPDGGEARRRKTRKLQARASVASPGACHVGSLFDFDGGVLATVDSSTTSIQVKDLQFDVQLQGSELLLSRTSVTDNRESCIAGGTREVAETMVTLRADLATLEQEIERLTQLVQDGGDDFESAGLRLTRVLGLKGQHMKKLQQLGRGFTINFQRERRKTSVTLPSGVFTRVSCLGMRPILWCQNNETEEHLVESVVFSLVEEELVYDAEEQKETQSSPVPSTPPTRPAAGVVTPASKKRTLNEETTVHLSNLPFVSTEAEVKSWFEHCGEIERVLLPVFADSQKRKGYGFVEFSTAASVAKALELTGMKQHNRVVEIHPTNRTPAVGRSAGREKESGKPRQSTPSEKQKRKAAKG